MSSVPNLLAQSQQAHVQAQVCRKARNFSGHLQCLSEALERRLEAHALDPEHRDPAWAIESAPSRKQRFLHDEVLAFYRKELGIAPERVLEPVRGIVRIAEAGCPAA